MPDNAEFDRLYAEAKSALKKREYDRATGLLTQILVIDENYKDVPRLLAQTVKLKRRRWYNNPALWNILAFVVVIGLGIWLSRTLPRQTAALPVETTVTPSIAAIPAKATVILTPTTTPIPLIWRRVAMGQEFARDEIISIVQDRQDKDLIYVRAKYAGVYRTLNGGASWQPTAEAMRVGGDNGFNPDMRLPGKCSILATNPQDNRFAYCVIEIGIYRTQDSGANWQLSNPQVEWIKALLISPHDPQVTFAGGQGLSVSKDGGQTWQPINNGLPNIPMQLTISPQDRTVFFAQEYINTDSPMGFPVYRSADSGQTWKPIIKNNCSLMFDADGNPVCGFKISLDNGETWNNMKKGAPLESFDSAIGSNFPYSSTVVMKSFKRASHDFFISQDKGKTLKQIPPLDTDQWDFRIRFYFDHQQGQVIYSIALQGRDATPLLHRSDDSGETWKECFSPAVSSPDTNTRLAVDYNDSNRIYLATRGQGVYVSYDGCKKWEETNEGLTNLYVNTIVSDPNDTNILYVGTDGGAYVSYDSGATWGQVNDGLLGATVVYSIAVDKDGNVYAATPYGVFKLESK